MDNNNGSLRTCRTHSLIVARNQHPLPLRYRVREIRDCSQTFGVEGGEGEGWRPDVEFEDHDLFCLWQDDKKRERECVCVCVCVCVDGWTDRRG